MRKKLASHVQWMLVWVLACLVSCFASAATVVLDQNTSNRIIGVGALSYYIDPADAVTINDILKNSELPFEPTNRDVLNLGHSDSSVWASFDLHPTGLLAAETVWYLEIGFPALQRMSVYLVRNGEVVAQHEIGYARLIQERALPSSNFVQPLVLEKNADYRVYINVMRKGGVIQLPVAIYDTRTFIIHQIDSNYIFGILYGIMLGMIIYNAYLYLAIRSRAYLYYLLYIGMAAVALLSTTGYGYYFLWPRFPILNEYMQQIPSCLGIIGGLLFCRHFIKVWQYVPLYNKLISWSVYVGLLLILVRLSTDYFLSEAITVYMSLASVLLPVIAFHCWRKGSRSAGFFLIGWSALFVSIFLYTLSLLALIPSDFAGTNAVIAGATLETLLLSLGLADRINQERKQKYQALEAQHEAVLRLQEAEQRLVHRALHNNVTGLPNRTFLRTCVETRIAERKDKVFSIVLINFNNFHEFNKTLGHSNGDAILFLATQRMNQSCIKLQHFLPLEHTESGIHYVAGIEGVTFGMMMDRADPLEVQRCCLQLMQDLERSFEFQGLTLEIDTTTSAALYPQHGDNSEHLIRNAHIALEVAQSSSEKLAIYSQKIDPYSERRISLLGELRQAIASDQLQLYLQPQISLKTNRVEGAEVLLRWIHPEYGFIPPDEFIPLAERTGVIHSLTYWVCKHAFRVKSELASRGYDLALSINVSARNLQDLGFKQNVALIADEEGTSLHDIVMELTETAIMTDPDLALKMMTELSDAGVRLSIDDFGTGYSSLSYLKRLPVKEIKIDRSFVMEMANNSEDQLLVKTTLSMGHNFSMVVVAEGIEDEVTLDLLKDMGCDLAQGYHIARPMPVDAFMDWLSANATWTSPQSVGGSG